MIVLITGASGFVGSALIKALKEMKEVTEIRALTRPSSKPSRLDSSVKAFTWDAETETPPAASLKDVDAVFHLAGENVGQGRWTKEVRERILDSREKGTRNLVAGLNLLSKKPVLISTSAVGFYGSRGSEVLTEESSPGEGFLAKVCGIWEAEANKYTGPRTVLLRFGVVLGNGGGMMGKVLPVFKAGVGGQIGDGKHWTSWIHLEDLVRLLIRAATDPLVSGIYNAVAPEPVTNETFTKSLGHVLHRPTLVHVPAFALRLALGEMADQTLLASQRVTSLKLSALGFPFHYPTLDSALQNLSSHP
ncbi:MAG: TIGR01777 family protein [Cryobacterium sp.]|nr:TIGR01777 family protein [Oligoflexia bacterium]